jgi:hypothetical protein
MVTSFLLKLGYNPKPSRADCTRRCGNISVPFPFGLEEGCFARQQFRLVCTNVTTPSVLTFGASGYYQVIDLNVNEGIMSYSQQNLERLVVPIYNSGEDRFLFVNYGSVSSAGWVAANLSCAEAKQNTSGYACVSINSSCVEVNIPFSVYNYIGYRCKCLEGFQGNPYVQNGCRGTNRRIPLFLALNTKQ